MNNSVKFWDNTAEQYSQQPISTWEKLIGYFWKAREAGEAEGAGEER